MDYNLYYLDKRDHIILRRTFSGPDDLSALDEANRLSTTHTIEVWELERFVARVEKHRVSVRT